MESRASALANHFAEAFELDRMGTSSVPVTRHERALHFHRRVLRPGRSGLDAAGPPRAALERRQELEHLGEAAEERARTVRRERSMKKLGLDETRTRRG